MPAARNLPFWKLLLLVLVLLVFVKLRIQQIAYSNEYPDEIFAVWSVQGTLEQALARRGFDWPPLHSAITWGWQQLVGQRYEAARVLSVLLSTLSAALLYRCGRLIAQRWHYAPYWSGLGAVLAYGGMLYAVFIGFDLRGYGITQLTGILLLWRTLAWLQRPSHGARVGVILALMLCGYTSFTHLLLLGAVALLVLFMQPRRIGEWLLLLGGGALTALPLVGQFMSIGVFTRSEQVVEGWGTLSEETLAFYANLISLPVLLLSVGAAGIVGYAVRQWRVLLWFVLMLAIPSVLYLLNRPTLLQARYLLWLMPVSALLIGAALSILPRWGRVAALALLLWVVVQPMDFAVHRFSGFFVVPYRDVFSHMAQHYRSGDVIVKDPRCYCGEPMGWDYFLPLYFPNTHLNLVTAPQNANRVWYFHDDDPDPQLMAAISTGRIPRQFFGPWNMFVQLYERPAYPEGVAFGENLRLNGAELVEMRYGLRENDSFQVRTWWSTTAPLPADYSFSVAVLRPDGSILAQQDGQVQAGATAEPQPSITWQPNLYYEDIRTLTIPDDTPPGDYPLIVIVYQSWDGKRLSPAENPLWETLPNDILLIQTIAIWSW